eukprot:1420454-Pleurochrysis_carterae.AAC.2
MTQVVQATPPSSGAATEAEASAAPSVGELKGEDVDWRGELFGGHDGADVSTAARRLCLCG